MAAKDAQIEELKADLVRLDTSLAQELDELALHPLEALFLHTQYSETLSLNVLGSTHTELTRHFSATNAARSFQR